MAETETIEAPAESAEVTAPAQTSAAPADDFSDLLAQFEADTASSQSADPSQTDAFVQQQVDAAVARENELRRMEAAQAAMEAESLRQQALGYEQRAGEFERLVTEMQTREYWRQQDEAFAKLLSETERDIKEQFPDVPASFVANFFKTRAAEDQATRDAWFNQQQNPRAWNVALRRLRYEMQKELSSRIDPEATTDRAAIAAFMKSASGPINAEPPPKFATMSNREFEDYCRKHYGF